MKTKNKLLIITIIALLLRIQAIDWGFENENRVIFDDEVFYYESTNNINVLKGEIQPSTQGAFFPQLYIYIINIIWTLLNLETFRQKVVIARLTTAIFGALMPLIVYLVTKNIKNEKTGVIAAVFTAISMGLVSHSQMFKQDIPMVLFILLTIYFLLKYLNNKKTKNLIISCILAIVSVGMKQFGIISVLSIVISVILQKDKRELIKLLMIGLLCLPLISLFYPQITNLRTFTSLFIDYYNLLTSKEIVQKGFDLYGTVGVQYTRILYPILILLPYGIGIPLFLLEIGGIAGILKKLDRKKILLLLTGAPYLLLVGQFNLTSLRYFLLIIPLMAILGGLFIAKMPKVIILIILLFTINHSIFWNYKLNYNGLEDMKEWVTENIAEGSIIYGNFKYPYASIDRYYEERLDFDSNQMKKYNPDYIVIEKTLKSISQRNPLLDRTRAKFYKELDETLNYSIIAEFSYGPSKTIYGRLDPVFDDYFGGTYLIYQKNYETPATFNGVIFPEELLNCPSGQKTNYESMVIKNDTILYATRFTDVTCPENGKVGVSIEYNLNETGNYLIIQKNDFDEKSWIRQVSTFKPLEITKKYERKVSEFVLTGIYTIMLSAII